MSHSFQLFNSENLSLPCPIDGGWDLGEISPAFPIPLSLYVRNSLHFFFILCALHDEVIWRHYSAWIPRSACFFPRCHFETQKGSRHYDSCVPDRGEALFLSSGPGCDDPLRPVYVSRRARPDALPVKVLSLRYSRSELRFARQGK